MCGTVPAGLQVTVADADATVVSRFIADHPGARAASGPESYGGVDALILMLPTSDIVEAVLEDGKTARAGRGDGFWMGGAEGKHIRAVITGCSQCHWIPWRHDTRPAHGSGSWRTTRRVRWGPAARSGLAARGGQCGLSSPAWHEQVVDSMTWSSSTITGAVTSGGTCSAGRVG
jgi:hypothetical protein